jgi:hypothetical protein
MSRLVATLCMISCLTVCMGKHDFISGRDRDEDHEQHGLIMGKHVLISGSDRDEDYEQHGLFFSGIDSTEHNNFSKKYCFPMPSKLYFRDVDIISFSFQPRHHQKLHDQLQHAQLWV